MSLGLGVRHGLWESRASDFQSPQWEFEIHNYLNMKLRVQLYFDISVLQIIDYGLCWTQVVFMLDTSENEKGSTAWPSYMTMLNQENLCSSLYASDYGVLVRAQTSNIADLLLYKLA